MTHLNALNVKLYNLQVNSKRKTANDIILNLPSILIRNIIDDNNFQNKILLTNRQVLRFMITGIKISNIYSYLKERFSIRYDYTDHLH